MNLKFNIGDVVFVFNEAIDKFERRIVEYVDIKESVNHFDLYLYVLRDSSGNYHKHYQRDLIKFEELEYKVNEYKNHLKKSLDCRFNLLDVHLKELEIKENLIKFEEDQG